MLGKLLKHEFHYYAKRYIPFAAIILAVAVVLCIMTRISGGDSVYEMMYNDMEESDAFYVVFSLLASVLGVATSVLTIYVFYGGISRFEKNLFSDEGYLMNTLPVKSSQLILSKFIGAVSCWIACNAVIMLSSWLVYGEEDSASMSLFFSVFSPYYSAEEEISLQIFMYAYELATYCAFMLLCYMCQSIRNRLASRRGMAFFIGFAFLIINVIIISFITGFVYAAEEDTGHDYYYALQLVMLIYYVIVSIVMFAVTNSNMKNHLNLE